MKHINEIKLAELQRALDDTEGRYPYIGVGKHSVDTEMLRDLVKLAQEQPKDNLEPLELARDAHSWGFEQGWEAAVDSIGSPRGKAAAFESWKKNL